MATLPPVWQMLSGKVRVTQWQRQKGETKAWIGPSEKTWVGIEKISRHTIHAIVAAEDVHFYEHPGIDIRQIMLAARNNFMQGRYAFGASTISQQVVKMVFLTREKTILRKLREVAGVFIMELLLTKDQIIAWYINLVEFGDGIYGVRNAARHYFQTEPGLLTIAQSIHIALVLPSPNRWSLGLRQRSLTEFGKKRFMEILDEMFIAGVVTKHQYLATATTGDFGQPLTPSSNKAVVNLLK